MSLLSDTELVGLLSGERPMVSEFPDAVALANRHDPYAKGSTIQPASVDLHIGEIVLPGREDKDGHPVAERRREYCLPPGYSAIVESHETFDMPKNIGALAFPVAGRRQQGTLMLNPGHIDPGYKGKLWFTLINVSRWPVPMRRGDRVATVLFWSMGAESRAPWESRYGIADRSKAPAAAVESISGDCFEVEKRSREVAEGVTNRAKITVTMLSIALPAVATLVFTVVASYLGGVQQAKERLAAAEARIQVLEGKMDYGTAIMKLGDRLDRQEAALDSARIAPTKPRSNAKNQGAGEGSHR